MAPDKNDALWVQVTRSGVVESRHRVAVVVADGCGALWSAGDPDQEIVVRSAVKPFQALPTIEAGVPERLGWGPEQLALMTASHQGTERHVDVALGMLRSAGFAEDDLGCGAHAPLAKAARVDLARRGGAPTRAMNNCSGKHAGFLALCQSLGEDPRTYLDPQGRTQTKVRSAVAALVGLAPERLRLGLDGCGAPTFVMPLAALARGFARLANPAGLGTVRARSCRTLSAAITACPDLLAGAGRLGTALVRAFPGAVFPKNGAEGVYGFGCIEGGYGVAVKVLDGATRGCPPVVCGLAARVLAAGTVPEALQEFWQTPVRNTLGVQVGEVSCADPLPIAFPAPRPFDGAAATGEPPP